MYSEDLNIDHLNTGKSLNTQLFEVWISNGWSVGYFLCTRPAVQIPDQYLRKQDRVHLSSIQMAGLSGLQMAFKNQTILHPTSFRPFEYQTSSVFRSPLYWPSLVSN